jgi:hypothetical protein
MSDGAERYLQQLASRLPRRHRRRILTEIRYHVEEAVADAQKRGVSPGAAERLALEELGTATSIADQFAANPKRRPGPSGRLGVAAAGGLILAAVAVGVVATLEVTSSKPRAAAPTPSAAPRFGPINVPGQEQALAALNSRYRSAHATSPMAVFTSPPPLDNGFTASLWVIPLPHGHLCPLLQILDEGGAVVEQTAGSNQSWCVTSTAPGPPSLIGNYPIRHDPDQRIILGRAPGALDVEVKLADGTSIERPGVLKAFFLIVVNGTSKSATTPTRITSYLGLAPPTRPGAATTWRTLTAT